MSTIFDKLTNNEDLSSEIGYQDIIKTATQMAKDEEMEFLQHEMFASKTDTFVALSSPPSTKFDELIKLMDSIHPSNLVYKQILKSGFGPTIQMGQQVLVHYEMYFENTMEPFDSTILREKPTIIEPDNGILLEGLRLGILTMNLKEISKFIFSWECGFGEYGCPPRIPPKADICCFVEIIKIIESPKIKEGNELAVTEGTFDTRVKDVEDLLQQGKSLFVSRRFDDSIKKMNDAIHLLESIALQSDEEQQKMEDLMVRLNVNLSAMYNHCNKPELACIHCQNALKMNPKHKKALFNYGRANIRLNNFDTARKHLTRGLKLYPNDAILTQELRRLTEKEEDLAKRIQNLVDTNELS